MQARREKEGGREGGSLEGACRSLGRAFPGRSPKGLGRAYKLGEGSEERASQGRREGAWKGLGFPGLPWEGSEGEAPRSSEGKPWEKEGSFPGLVPWEGLEGACRGFYKLGGRREKDRREKGRKQARRASQGFPWEGGRKGEGASDNEREGRKEASLLREAFLSQNR